MSELDIKIEAAVREAGPSGLHQQQLEAFREVPQMITEAVARLVKARRVEVIRNSDGAVVLFIPALSGGLSEGCAVVLEAIKNSGGEGIDLAAILSKTKIMRMEVTKAIKTLMEKKIIEETRSFTNKAKKVYIQAGVTLSHAVTGGVFYATAEGGKNREIDFMFVDNIRAAIMDYFNTHKVVSTTQIKHYFDGKSLPKAVSQKDVDVVTHTLQLDGFIETVSPLNVGIVATALGVSGPPPGTGGTFYRVAPNQSQTILRASQLGLESTVATQVPCMGCPLLTQCSSSGLGPVNPTACVYLNEWLRLE